ncbi:MAG: anti-sigma regulatory factor [Synechococcales bacterium]|nr:anti-sigma regulatory factor [Synechococcales bacterium]
MMTEHRSGQLPISGEEDIVIIRQFVRDRVRKLGFGITDVTRVVTAASELTRNIYLYAGAGVLRWRELTERDRRGIELIFQDEGPGIPSIEAAMEVGFSTKGLLGLGLPGVKRLMDEMEIVSEMGIGTTVTVRKWIRKI